MASRLSTNQKSKPSVVHKIEKDNRYLFSPKTTLNLMQNCDLPPPIKLFSGPETLFLQSIREIYRVDHEQIDMHNDCSIDDDKLEILKALRLSQTRAREAERKLGDLSEERERLSKLIVDESMRVFGYRQSVNLMEIQVLKMHTLTHCGVCNCAEESLKDCEEGDDGSEKWCTVIALCLAIAGMGFAFGCRYFF